MLPGVKGSGWGIEIPLGPFGSLLFPPSFLSLSIDCLHVCGNGAGAAELCLLSADFILVHQTRGFGVGWGGQLPAPPPPGLGGQALPPDFRLETLSLPS